MKLTSNETAWAIMIISLAYGTVLAWITIKAQHAKSIAELKDDIKNTTFRIVLGSCNLFAIILLVYEVFSSRPVSRNDIFCIVWSMGIIFLTAILITFNCLMKVAISDFILQSMHREEYNRAKNLILEGDFDLKQWLK